LRERGHVPQVDLRSALAAQLVVRLGKRIRGRICWRSSMYDIEGFFTNNPINRYGIGNMAEKLQPDADGGLMITIQHESPDKDREAKWLPAPAEAVLWPCGSTSQKSACTAATTSWRRYGR
jgi:hypothetical protein